MIGSFGGGGGIAPTGIAGLDVGGFTGLTLEGLRSGAQEPPTIGGLPVGGWVDGVWLDQWQIEEITQVQPVVSDPPLDEAAPTIEELAEITPGEAAEAEEAGIAPWNPPPPPPYTVPPTRAVWVDPTGPLQVIDQFLKGVNVSWMDDAADLIGLATQVGEAAAQVYTQFNPPDPILNYQGAPPGGGGGQQRNVAWNGFDMPGVDVGGQGSVSLRGGPFFEGATKLRTRRILQFRHPETGRIIWFRNMGRPILWSGDKSTVRRYNRHVGPARRVRAAKTGKRGKR